MRLLDRYLLREFLIPLGFCLGGFLILWIAFDLFGQLHWLQEQGLSVFEIAEYYCFKSPEFLILVLPVALLLAMLYTLTNHARHNEITAIRAAGVSLARLCAPYLVVGLLSSVLLFALDEFCVPRTTEIADQLFVRHGQLKFQGAQGRPVKNLVFFKVVSANEKRHWFIGTYNQQTGEMSKPHLDWDLPDRSSRSIYADRAIYTNGVWTFFKVWEYRNNSQTNALLQPMPSTNVLTFPEFSETPEMIRSEIVINDKFLFQSATHSADIPVSQIYNYLRLHPQPGDKIRPWIYTKLQGRFAGPFACLVVVLVAIPFAAASGRRNVYVGVAASILIFFTYYIVQQMGFTFGETGKVPPWLGAWLPNLFFVIASLRMILKVR